MGGIGKTGNTGNSGAANSSGGGAAGAMGAIGTGIGLGSSLYGLMRSASDSRKEYKRNVKNLYLQQQQKNNRRKNLLEEQLAARRAQIGALGMSGDGSNAAATRKIVDDAYNDIIDENAVYDMTYRDLEKEYSGNRKQDLLEYFMKNGSQLIK